MDSKQVYFCDSDEAEYYRYEVSTNYIEGEKYYSNCKQCCIYLWIKLKMIKKKA
jgi:hypothetical protein